MSIMGDLGAYLPVETAQAIEVKHSTNKRAGTELDMMDYLQLMIASLQNQTIDDTVSTSDMMNQMSTMSMMQAITNLNTVLSETSNMTYAASLVGKEVTVAIGYGSDAYEYTGKVTGVSVLNGEPIIFIGNDMFYLSDIIAIGKLPSEIDGEIGKDEDGDGKVDDGDLSGEDDEVPSEGEETETVRLDRGTGTYYGYSFNEDDFEYKQDDTGAIHIIYKGENGASASNMGVTEQMIPGGADENALGVAAATGIGTQQDTAQDQNSAGAEAAAAEWFAENG